LAFQLNTALLEWLAYSLSRIAGPLRGRRREEGRGGKGEGAGALAALMQRRGYAVLFQATARHTVTHACLLECGLLRVQYDICSSTY